MKFRLWSSALFCCLVLWLYANVSEGHTVLVFGAQVTVPYHLILLNVECTLNVCHCYRGIELYTQCEARPSFYSSLFLFLVHVLTTYVII